MGWIRIRMDPKLLPGSGSGTKKFQSWIRNRIISQITRIKNGKSFSSSTKWSVCRSEVQPRRFVCCRERYSSATAYDRLNGWEVIVNLLEKSVFQNRRTWRDVLKLLCCGAGGAVAILLVRTQSESKLFRIRLHCSVAEIVFIFYIKYLLFLPPENYL